jgi:hypothetical protein
MSKHTNEPLSRDPSIAARERASERGTFFCRVKLSPSNLSRARSLALSCCLIFHENVFGSFKENARSGKHKSNLISRLGSGRIVLAAGNVLVSLFYRSLAYSLS